MRAHVTLIVLLAAALAALSAARDYRRLTEIPCKFQHVLSVDTVRNTT